MRKPICLPFARAFLTVNESLSGCPHIPEDTLRQFPSRQKKNTPIEEEFDVVMKRLKDGLLGLDLTERAATNCAEFKDDAIVLPILGKPFRIDRYSKDTTKGVLCHAMGQ